MAREMALRSPPEEWQPRLRARHELCSITDPHAVDPHGRIGEGARWREHEGFPEVPDAVAEGSWAVIRAGRLRFDEHIGVTEGRAFLWKLRHDARQSSRHGSKRLYLVENFSFSAALAKGRSPAFCLLQICRRSSALQLGSGIQPHVRWLSSERNAADGPSRVFGQSRPLRLLPTSAPRWNWKSVLAQAGRER